MRENALIARKLGVWQGYLTGEKAERERKVSDRIGAKGSAKKGQKNSVNSHTGVRYYEFTLLVYER